MSDCRKCADFYWCVEHEDCGLFKPKPQTNADLIRAMSDEKLAEYLSNIDDMSCAADDTWKCRSPASCKDCILEWLKQEADK